MCRNIKTLFNFEPPASEDEVRAAARQAHKERKEPCQQHGEQKERERAKNEAQAYANDVSPRAVGAASGPRKK